MNKKLYSAFLIFMLVICTFSCSLLFFDTKTTDTTITIPTSIFRDVEKGVASRDTREGVYKEYYVEYILCGDVTKSGISASFTEQEISNKTEISFSIEEVQYNKNYTLFVNFVSKQSSSTNAQTIRMVLSTGQATIKNLKSTDKPNIQLNTFSGYNVGDLILKNGLVIPYSEENIKSKVYSKLANDAVAVIFRATADGNPALGVGVKQTKAAWATEEENSDNDIWYTTKIDSLCISFNYEDSTIGGYTDGIDSWNMICNHFKTGDYTEEEIASDQNIDNYPAFNFAENYATDERWNKSLDNTEFVTGWYLPTVAEFDDIYKNISVLNDILKGLGGIIPIEKDDEKFFATINQAITHEWYWTCNQASGSESADTKAFYYFPKVDDKRQLQDIIENNTYDKGYADCYVLVIHRF